MCRTFSLDSVRCPVPYLIVRARTPRAARRFLRTVRPRDELGLVAVWVLAPVTKDGCCFVVDTHVVRLL